MTSIRTKLTFVIIFLLTASLLSLGLLQSLRLQEVSTETIRVRLLAQARQTAAFLAETASRGDDTELQLLIKQVATQGESRLTVIASDGRVLADSEQAPEQMENHGDRPEVIGAWQHGEYWSVRRSDTLALNMLYVGVTQSVATGSPVVVRLALPLTQVQAATRQLWQALFSVLAAVLLVALGVAVFVGRSFTQPIEAMIAAGKGMAEGDLSQRVSVNRSDELGVLAQTFNRLASASEERFSELRSAKAQLETILRNTVSGIFLLDEHGRVLFSNPSAARMLGFDLADLPANHWQVTRNLNMSQALEEALQSGAVFKQDIAITVPAERVVELNVVPLLSNGHSIAVFYDVSEARRLAAVRADLVANVSHELKTPVTSIHGFAETLLQGAMDDEESRKRFISIIYRESGRLLRLVKDLLDLSHLELDPRAIEKKPTDLRHVVREAVERYLPKAEEKGIYLRTVVGVDEAWLQADEYRLGQALGNLIENALKYTQAGGQVRVVLQYEKGSFAISVRDTGIGIAPEHLDRIFERFYRADRARSRQHGGTGLGLSIVKHIIELHGGEVWAESKAGEGTSFYLRLPAERPNNLSN